jgi:S1-C subfamily serine protease
VFADGPAFKAGLQSGDVIMTMNGHPVEDRRAYLFLLRNHQPREALAVHYYRNGKSNNVSLIPTAFDDKLAESYARKRWGLSVREGRRGLLVDEVRAGSPADRMGFERDDCITGIGGRTVKTRDDYLNAFRRAYLNQQILLQVVRNNRMYQVRMSM